MPLFVAAALTACDDTTDTIGSSLTNASDLISVSDGTFAVQTRTIVADSVLSRNTTGYLGRVKDPETGAYVRSNFLTQFHVPESYAFPATAMLPNGQEADSCDLRLFFDKYYGDSLTVMHATVYELSRPIEENENYYTTFDPVSRGLVRLGEGTVRSEKAFTLVNTNLTDSLRHSGSYTNNILFSLNAPYTDTQGRTYRNYGSYIMKRYYAEPQSFKNSYTFAHSVCPGFYVRLDNGVGCMAYIRSSQMNVYYTMHDSIDHSSYNSFAGTEEVRQVTQIANSKDRLAELAADRSCTYVKAPAGLYTELTLPIDEAFKGHETDSINSARIELKCLNPTVDGTYALPAPATLLLVEKSRLREFFENGEIANYRTSFVATYSSTSNSYTFGNIGQLMKHMEDALPQDAAKRTAYKAANPDWNRVVLVPVSANYTTQQSGYSSTSKLTSLSHDMSLSSVRLVGGTSGEVKMTVIYSRFSN